MNTIENMDRFDIIELLNKCWMTHDGMWFAYCLQESGIEAANKINKAALKSLSSIEIKRIGSALGYDKTIQGYKEFQQFFIAATQFVILRFMNFKLGFPGGNMMTWEVETEQCFAYKGIKRLGIIDRYECGVLFRIKCWLEALEIEHTVTTEIDKCNMYHKGACSGTIQLSFR